MSQKPVTRAAPVGPSPVRSDAAPRPRGVGIPARLIALGAALALVAGCSSVRQSRFNPANWFGGSQEDEAPPQRADETADGRLLVREVTEVVVEPVGTGALVRATGLPPTQGWWDAELVAHPIDEEGRMVFDFRVSQPPGPTPASTPVSRQIVAAAYLSNAKLREVREIIVRGAENARATRR